MAFDIILLPYVGAFLFVFAIILGLLTSAKLFNRNINAAIAVVFGIFSAMYAPFVDFIQTFLPISAIILIVIFFFVFIKKLFEKKEGQKPFDALPVAVVLICLIIILISQWRTVQGFLPPGIDATNAGWGLGILLIVIILFAVYKHESPAAGPGRS